MCPVPLHSGVLVQTHYGTGSCFQNVLMGQGMTIPFTGRGLKQLSLSLSHLLLLLPLMTISHKAGHYRNLVHARLFCCFHSPSNSDMDYRILLHTVHVSDTFTVGDVDPFAYSSRVQYLYSRGRRSFCIQFTCPIPLQSGT